jgi:hypothetical protein
VHLTYVYNCGRISATTNTNFDDGNIQTLRNKHIEAKQRHLTKSDQVSTQQRGKQQTTHHSKPRRHAKIWRAGRAETIVTLPKVLGEQLVGDSDAVDAKALRFKTQMRRRVQTGSQTTFAQNSLDKCARRTFAFGAGDVDDAQRRNLSESRQ